MCRSFQEKPCTNWKIPTSLHLCPLERIDRRIGDIFMNSVLLRRLGAAWFWCVLLFFAAGEISCWASEYEVEGEIHQVITEANGYREETTNEFTVSVRDCGWLIQVIGQDKKGNALREEIGSTNGSEIFDLVTPTGIATQKKARNWRQRSSFQTTFPWDSLTGRWLGICG